MIEWWRKSGPYREVGLLQARVLGWRSHGFVGDVCGWSERVSIVALLASLVALVPIAHVTPPDPLWIAGIYDAADFDDVVDAVVAASGLRQTRVYIPRPGDVTTGAVFTPVPLPLPCEESVWFYGRAPPSGLSRATR